MRRAIECCYAINGFMDFHLKITFLLGYVIFASALSSTLHEFESLSWTQIGRWSCCAILAGTGSESQLASTGLKLPPIDHRMATVMAPKGRRERTDDDDDWLTIANLQPLSSLYNHAARKGEPGLVLVPSRNCSLF